MKFQVKVEYGKDKFVKFYVEADVVDGIVANYSFSSLVEDIRRTCGSLRHHTSSTLRVRYKDEDGDFVNLNEDDTDNFQEMFVRASSVDEGLYRKIILRVSELDSPVVQPLGLARKRKIQEISYSGRDTEHKLDPLSLESSFACAATSSVKPKRSPLDHVETELAENVQLKKILLSSAEEELRKATRENDALTPLSAIRSRICGNCHKSGHTRPRCTSPPCNSHDACGLRDKHPELKEKMSGLQKEIKQLQQEHSDAESKLKAFCESRKKASTSFFAVMRPRLKARNLIKYSDRVSLDRDLLILEKALTGKVPEFDMSEDWQLPVLIEQYRNRNVDVYLNRAAERRSAISNE
ncbi:PREDICTED: uncharacterized protein LOC107341151 [Acropora digitifera]|uniref:uncharacterized protein LOC107341151 n=1 Tax=Acropora digitifera TaxID=70779 RepID=UPI00077A334D|nr:PREDICTED: uncharacterized protein LOC107341151 [Acropora digitifera]